MSIPDGLRRVREQPGFVYVTEAFSSYDLIERSYMAEEICDLNEILFRPEELLYEHLHRNSSYTEFVRLKYWFGSSRKFYIKNSMFNLQTSSSPGIGYTSSL